MRLTQVSWSPTISVIVIILQTQALIIVKTTGKEGERFDFRCEYPQHLANNSKYFCHVDNTESSGALIRTDKHDQWERDGRFALYDNTTGGFFVVRVDKLEWQDRGEYWCGTNVNNMQDHITTIQLDVSTEHSMHLYLTIGMCLSALLFVSLFSCCLLLTVRNPRSSSSRNKETSCDYETMSPGVGLERECDCQCCTDLAASPPPPLGPPPQFPSKLRGSALPRDPGDYIIMDVPESLCQYQDLDRSHLENHVYHSIVADSNHKHGPAGETINHQ